MEEMEEQMRYKIAWFLIRLANKIKGDDGYYELGDPITGMIEHKGELVVCTDRNIYSTKDGKKFVKVKVDGPAR